MGAERGRQLLIAVVALLLAAVVYQAWPTPSAAPAATSDSSGARRSATREAAVPAAPGPGVHLEALSQDRPTTERAERDLFRFKPKPPPPAPLRVVAPGVSAGPAPDGPSQPPTLPPIPLKFIGIVDVPGQSKQIAALTDSKGGVFHGMEGETVEGRYKILKIGVESIEMSYIDGRGRQTIRLTGGS
jgi:hypothetical protein